MPKRPNKYPAKSDQRRKDLAMIHIAAEQLGMDPSDKEENSEYRCMLWSVARVRSSASLDFAGRKKVLEHMEACGFKRTKPQPRKLADDPESKKIRALWLLLHEIGLVKNPSESALAAYISRMTKVDDLHWINGDQSLVVIESLKKWAMRNLPAKVIAMAAQSAADIKSGSLKLTEDEFGQLAYTVRLAQDRGTFDPMQDAYLELKKWLPR